MAPRPKWDDFIEALPSRSAGGKTVRVRVSRTREPGQRHIQMQRPRQHAQDLPRFNIHKIQPGEGSGHSLTPPKKLFVHDVCWEKSVFFSGVTMVNISRTLEQAPCSEITG